MWNDGQDEVRVAYDLEIESVAAVNAALPNASSLIVFFGSQRRMAKILPKQIKLLVRLSPQNRWQRFVITGCAPREMEAHHLNRL